MALLVPAPQYYEWGSTTALQSLTGCAPSGSPLAELWFGTHPNGETGIAGSGTETLTTLVEADPASTLGEATIERFGPRLPFLVKFLAAQRALSIQVHPDAAQATRGFDREEALGIPIDSPRRTYRDRSPKPEILIALSRFEALCGIRPPAETVAFFDSLDVRELNAFRWQLLAGPKGVAATVGQLLTMAPGDCRHLVGKVAEAANRPTQRWNAEARCIGVLARQYPADAGVIVAALLNHVVLEPGSAVYLGAGNVHAYLHGVGLEVLASSDNVVRGGLTSKHIDITELLAIADFTPLVDPVIERSDDGYLTPAREFQVKRLDLAVSERVSVTNVGPTMYVCAEGDAGALRRGQVVWAPASTTHQELSGPSTVYVVSVPL